MLNKLNNSIHMTSSEIDMKLEKDKKTIVTGPQPLFNRSACGPLSSLEFTKTSININCLVVKMFIQQVCHKH